MLSHHACCNVCACAAAMRHLVAFTDPMRIPYAHGKVGVSAMVLLWAQPLNAVLRPHPGVTWRRRIWEHLHALLGRAAITLGACTTLASCSEARCVSQLMVSCW